MPIDRQKLIFARMKFKAVKFRKEKASPKKHQRLIKSGSVALILPNENILTDQNKTLSQNKHTISSTSICQNKETNKQMERMGNNSQQNICK